MQQSGTWERPWHSGLGSGTRKGEGEGGVHAGRAGEQPHGAPEMEFRVD